MINYLFSGIDKQKGFNKMQEKYLKNDIKNNSIIVFIASSFDNISKNDFYYNKMLSNFYKCHIYFKDSKLIDNRVDKGSAVNYIERADIIFLLGGDTYNQMVSINEYGLKDSIKHANIVIGVSAGALNQSSVVIYEDQEIIEYEGLGLTEINIYPHVDNMNLMDEALRVSAYRKIIALPNASFVRIENNNIEYIGKYYVLDKKQER